MVLGIFNFLSVDRPVEKDTLYLAMKSSNGYSRLLVLAGLAFVPGCGLSEYQAKYEKQQERMNYVDQENQYLNGPLNVPVAKESKNPVANVFLRIPVGISRNYDETPEGILYRYPKISSKFSPEPGQKSSEIDSVYLAVESNKDWNDFKKRALEPFKGIESQNVRTVNLEALGRPARTFQTLSFTYGDDSSWSYQFYFFKEDPYRVAIGFRGSEKVMSSETAKQAMEFCVKTLAVGKAAGK
jgi:hypothetical protein